MEDNRIMATNGERSSIPNVGRTLRIGSMIGSVRESSERIKALFWSMGNQLTIARIKIAKYKSLTINAMKAIKMFNVLSLIN
jgi:hypothetical protein